MNAPLEKEVQKAVADYLSTLGLTYIHIVNEQQLFAMLPNNRSYALYNELKDRGYSPGFPDLLIFNKPPGKPERCGTALEIKRSDTSKSTLSDNQEDWLRRLRQRNWLVMVGWGIDDSIHKLQEAGYQ